MTRVYHIGLGIILLLAAVLRFSYLNWDSYQSFHPDERNIAWAVTRIKFFDQLNPQFFAYGGLPIYLYRAIGEVAVRVTHDPTWLTEWGKISVLGRAVSATLSTTSIFLIYIVGRIYFSAPVGLLSALLLAFSPWAIREAHFSTTETMLVFFLLSLLVVARAYLRRPARKTAYGMGLLLGLAIGAKTTSALFTVIPAMTFVLSLPTIHKSWRHRLLRGTGFGLLFTITAALAFLVTSPYTILDWSHFMESMRYETGVALGRFTVPYTLQFLGTIPYWYQVQTMLWQAGPVTILSVIGTIILLWGVGKQFLRELASRSRPLRVIISIAGRHLARLGLNRKIYQGLRASRKNSLTDSRSLILFLIFPIVYLAWQGHWFAKFARYNVPLLPFLTLTAAWLLVQMAQRVQKQKLALSICRICLFVGFVGLSIAWALANWTIYTRPQTRIAASEWINEHISSDAHLFTEHWNDGLPITIPNKPNTVYQRDLLNVYDDDNDTKRAYYGDKLPTADYIILSTRRIWGTMPSLTKKYPLTSVFYKKLLSNQLGFTEVATFTSYPMLFGITINDDAAEESVQVFDHPTVRIFQNAEKLSKKEIERRLTP